MKEQNRGKQRAETSPVDTYKIVTDRILEMMEQGTIPWHRPWEEGGWGQTPRNAVSNKPYRGVNVLLLQGLFADPRWITFKQALDLGGSVRKGEKGQKVVLWKSTRYSKENDEGEMEQRRGWLLRAWTVFNVSQCDGLKLPPLEPRKEIVDPYIEAKAMIDAMPLKPRVTFGSTAAYYVPLTDRLHMPDLQQFETADGFYATMFHELGHSTGHEMRLNRHGFEGLLGHFGSENYSREELCAEITSAFLCNEVGIRSDANLKNTVAYLQSWMRALKDDKRLIVWAASRSQDAADFIAGRYVKQQKEAA